ncbi:uncharacterized protein LOC105182116 [Harpegnathos saltator]|uniref:uncharacterized protein LOC105182116 n=1 Tax=Harpegnathos saltator TaxID=610380 RepID=UPI000590F036|nr:uncharacterized protein LOC105182116 [Harpegnathos saltator]
MKILIIVGVLFFTIMSYSYNVERAWEAVEHVHNCQQKLKTRALFSNLLLCIMVHDGQVLNAHGQFRVSAALRFIKDVIADKESMREAQALFNECYKNEFKKASSRINRTENIAICAMPIIRFFSRPQ